MRLRGIFLYAVSHRTFLPVFLMILVYFGVKMSGIATLIDVSMRCTEKTILKIFYNE